MPDRQTQSSITYIMLVFAGVSATCHPERILWTFSTLPDLCHGWTTHRMHPVKTRFRYMGLSTFGSVVELEQREGNPISRGLAGVKNGGQNGKTW